MTSCPLPIDWLDLLAGRPSEATWAHLGSCPACRATVASLKETQDTAVAGTSALIQLASTHSASTSPITPLHQERLAVGDIRWLEVDGVDVRLGVLVLMDLEDEIEDAFDVVPLLTDLENAVPGDLILNIDDTTVGIPWRAAFRSQTVVHRQYLNGLIGMATGAGKSVTLAALAGELSQSRTGVALESDHDPRLQIDQRMYQLLQAATIADYEDSQEDNILEIFTSSETSNQEPSKSNASRVFQIPLREMPEPTQLDFQLAAASRPSGTSVVLADFQDEALSIQFQARIWLDFASDRLIMHPKVVSGLPERVTIIIQSTQRAAPFEINAELQIDSEIILFSGAGISEYDIETLELRAR